MPTDAPRSAPDSAPFPYLRWAKAHLDWEAAAAGTVCLGMSGVAPLAADDRAALGLPPPPEVGSAIAGLKGALADRYGLGPAHVHLAAGTSHANFIVYLALARGGRIVVEEPAYEALHRLTDAVGATRRSLRRDPGRGWRIDPDSLAAAVDDDTDLIVLTDLHNPSGVRLVDEDLDAVLAAAARHDAHVLVDEVYSDFDPRERPSAVHRDGRVVVTNSLTKVHGLPDLRAGWVLADPAVIARIDAWDDLVHPALPPAPMVPAARYVAQARGRLEATRTRAAARAAQVDAWVATQPRVSWTRPDGGITGFLFLDGFDGDAVAAAAWAREGVRIVPGRYFQVPEALRISFLLPEAELARALDALGRVLEDHA